MGLLVIFAVVVLVIGLIAAFRNKERFLHNENSAVFKNAQTAQSGMLSSPLLNLFHLGYFNSSATPMPEAATAVQQSARQ
jgi:hypothetical protein